MMLLLLHKNWTNIKLPLEIFWRIQICIDLKNDQAGHLNWLLQVVVTFFKRHQERNCALEAFKINLINLNIYHSGSTFLQTASHTIEKNLIQSVYHLISFLQVSFCLFFLNQCYQFTAMPIAIAYPTKCLLLSNIIWWIFMRTPFYTFRFLANNIPNSWMFCYWLLSTAYSVFLWQCHCKKSPVSSPWIGQPFVSV